MRNTFIYFAQTVKSKHIKIGKTSRDPETRLKEIQLPEEIILLKAIKGDASLEAQLHEEFTSHALGREWFEPHPDLLRRIELIEDWDGNPPPTPASTSVRSKSRSQQDDNSFVYCAYCNAQVDTRVEDYLDMTESYPDMVSPHWAGKMMIGTLGMITGHDHACAKCTKDVGFTDYAFDFFKAHADWRDAYADSLTGNYLDIYIWLKANVLVEEILKPVWDNWDRISYSRMYGRGNPYSFECLNDVKEFLINKLTEILNLKK